MRRALSAGLLAAVLLPSCATLPALPPSPQIAADAEDRILMTSVRAYEDPELTAYLGKIIGVLLSEEERAGAAPEIVVVRDPTINAFAMLPDRIYLHTGLLSRIDNEAQLATIVAREVTHLRRRPEVALADAHARIAEALHRVASEITASTPFAEEGSAVLSPMAHAILGARLPRAYVASTTGFGRESEAIADAGAMERLVRAGYDPKEAPKVFERLRKEARAGGALERFLLGSDAGLAERIEVMTRLVSVATATVLATPVPDAAKGTNDFDKRMAIVTRENASLELRAGRFRNAEVQLGRVLAVAPADAMAYLYVGDLHRLRAQRVRSVADRDELGRKALAAYERCAALNPDIAEVPRQLGLLYYQLRQIDRAHEAFARYLTLSPNASDAARVREYLREGS
jgi:tetratricopeptide (TPR) repeat protein